MTLYVFEGKAPKVDNGAYVSPSAQVIGDVEIGTACFIAPGAVLRGDYGKISVGSCTSVQDNCVLHARPGESCKVGKRVTLGHGCIIHTCIIEDHAVIGMGAIVSDYAHVGEWAVVGEGAVVKQRQQIPQRSIAVGVPAKVIGELEEAQQHKFERLKDTYVELARRYASSLAQC